MKRLLILISAFFALAGGANMLSARQQDENDQGQNYQDQNYQDQNDQDRYDYGYNRSDVEGRFGFFYSSLQPYGEWVDCNYGYAWRPYRVGHAWRPYMDGRWVWTAYGWYWMSYEPFGWATYHYGRWSYDDYYGWIWIPDDVWGPSWVEFRYDNDYIGWAPLPPMARFRVGIGLTFSNSWVAPVHYWNFVPCRSFTSIRIVDYVQPIERTRRIFGDTRRAINIRADNDRVINNGIDVRFVERRGDVRVNRVDVVDNGRGTGERLTRDNNRERLEVYRPRLDARGDAQNPRDVRRMDQQSNDNGRRFDRQQPRIPSQENAPPQRGRRQDAPQPDRPRRDVQPQDRGWQQQQPQRNPRRENPWVQQQQGERGQVQQRQSRERGQVQQPPPRERGQVQQQQPREREQQQREPKHEQDRSHGERKSGRERRPF